MYEKWKLLAFANGHLQAAYDDEASWSLGYNLFADLWLQTGLLNASMIDSHVASLQPRQQTYGIPIDSTDAFTTSTSVFP
jgi:hypothetical protein